MSDLVEVMVFKDVYGKIYFKDFVLEGKRKIIVALPYYQNNQMWVMPIVGTVSLNGMKVEEIKKEDKILLANNQITTEFLYTLIKVACNGIRNKIEDNLLKDNPNLTNCWNEVKLCELDGCYYELESFIEEFEKDLNTDFQECRAIIKAFQHFKKNEEARKQQAEEWDKEISLELQEKGII